MKKTSFLIVGKHAVIEALKNPTRKIERVFLTEDIKKKISKENQFVNLFKNTKIFYKSRKELDNMCGKNETSHQGLIAEVEQLDEISLKEFVSQRKKKNINFIALEEVTDPRNIGSIIRSAAAFSIDGIIVKERSFPSKSKSLYKSASGGIEHVAIFKVVNINNALKFLKTKNFWVSAFDISGKKDFKENNWNGNNVLLFGSEGYGIKPKTLSNADFCFKINISDKIESLNISNTVAIVSHFIGTKVE